jgi:hypothetical protein
MLNLTGFNTESLLYGAEVVTRKCLLFLFGSSTTDPSNQAPIQNIPHQQNKTKNLSSLPLKEKLDSQVYSNSQSC